MIYENKYIDLHVIQYYRLKVICLMSQLVFNYCWQKKNNVDGKMVVPLNFIGSMK